MRVGSSSGQSASIAWSRATGCPRRAARIFSRSRAFFDFHASAGTGSPWRRTRKPPSVWSASGVGQSSRRPSARRPPGPRYRGNRAPAARARSVPPRACAGEARERELDACGRDGLAEVAPQRERVLEQGRCPAPPSRKPATRATRRGTACLAARRVLRRLLGEQPPRVRALLVAGRPSPRPGAGRGARSRSARRPRPRARRRGRGRRRRASGRALRGRSTGASPAGDRRLQRLLVGDTCACDLTPLAVEVALRDEVPRRRSVGELVEGQRLRYLGRGFVEPPEAGMYRARTCRPSLRIWAKPMRSASSVAASFSARASA